MRKEPHFEWDENLGQATCIIEDSQQRVFFGLATCHGNDMDMKSRRTGEEIAFRRARMDYLRQQRDDILLELKALKQLYYSMNQSKRFNPKSYENTMLQRQIRIKTFDLDTIKEMLASERESLKNLIDEKDKFYKQVRAYRNKAKNLQES